MTIILNTETPKSKMKVFHVLHVYSDFLVCIHSKLKDVCDNDQLLSFIMSSHNKRPMINSQFNGTENKFLVPDIILLFGV